jgi:SAM-dependent methyltransferase
MTKKANYSLKSKKAFGFIIPLTFLFLAALFIISLSLWPMVITIILGLLAANALVGIILGFSMHREKSKACRAIAGSLDAHSGGAILDVGAGPGVLTVHLAKSGFRATGVDVDEKSLQQARRNAELEEVKAEFHLGDGSSLKWPDNSFEAVTSLNLLHETNDPQAVFVDSYRVLKPEGTLAMADFRKGPATFSIFWLGFFKFLSRKTLHHLLRQAGFQDVHISNPTLFHHLVIARKTRDTR